MSHSFISSYFHCVFSTKERRRLITPKLQDALWSYIGGIARHNKMKALAVGGIEDHLHILLSLPSHLDVATAMQRVKGASSKWIHESFPEHRNFSWQEGYGAFSIGVSQFDATVAYINSQAEHHRTTTCFWPSWQDMASNTTSDTSGDEETVQSSLRDEL
jgi:REP element-mobilizing transposase RayT